MLLEIQFGVFPLDVKLTSLFLTPPQIPIWLQMTMRVGVFILFFLFYPRMQMCKTAISIELPKHYITSKK